jgi:hypothetical protein
MTNKRAHLRIAAESWQETLAMILAARLSILDIALTDR